MVFAGVAMQGATINAAPVGEPTSAEAHLGQMFLPYPVEVVLIEVIDGPEVKFRNTDSNLPLLRPGSGALQANRTRQHATGVRVGVYNVSVKSQWMDKH